MPVTLRVTNTAPEAVLFYHTGFVDHVYYDVRVTLANGTVIWNRLHGKTVLMALNSRTLAAGETFELSETWDLRNNDGQPVGPGVYHVQGVILGTGPPDLTTETKTVTISP